MVFMMNLAELKSFTDSISQAEVSQLDVGDASWIVIKSSSCHQMSRRD